MNFFIFGVIEEILLIIRLVKRDNINFTSMLFSVNHVEDALLLELGYQLEEAVGWKGING